MSTVNMRRLNLLLVLWCAFVIAPQALVEFGTFGRVDSQHFPGMLALAWVVGWLAQFGVFLWIMSIVPKQNMLWWFVASLLPWAADWSGLASPLFIWPCFLITIVVAVWISRSAGCEEWLQEHGIRAKGLVLEVLEPRMNVVINNVYIKRKVRLRIEREDGAPAYEGILNGLFMLGEIPSPGDKIRLIVDPANPQRFEDEEQESSSVADASSSRQAPSTAVQESIPGREDIAKELGELADLRDRGVISEPEFIAAKKKLLRD